MSTKAYLDRFLSVVDQNDKNLMQFLESSSVDQEYTELIDAFRRQSIEELTNLLSELDPIKNPNIEVASSHDEYGERIDHQNQRLNNVLKNRPMTMDRSTQTEDTMTNISDNHCEKQIQNQRHKKENLIPTMNWLTNARNYERGSLHLPIVLIQLAPFSPITKTYIIIYARTIQKHLSVHQMKDDDVRDVLLPVNNDGEETKSSSEVDWN
nr:uncharacterized protein LOC124493364 isoform X2 [Dermatophagoides farinae]